VIGKNPANLLTGEGTDATFTVGASGAASLFYQWQFNGTNIDGATSSSFTRTNIQPEVEGEYTVIVSNAEGVVTSAPPATLTIGSLPTILYEPFDYANIGSPVSSNTPANWVAGGSLPNDLNVANGNLFYPGLASVGNSVTNGGAGLGMRRLFGTNINSGTLWFSALFRINDLGYGTWNGAASQVGALTADNSSTFRLQILVKSNSPSGYVFGVMKNGAASGATFDTTEHHANETVLLVGKYDFTTTPNTASLWINPSSASFGIEAPTTGFISTNSGTDGFTIDRFNIRQNTAASVPAAMQWDELRVGNGWENVTPRAPRSTSSLENFVRFADGRIQFNYLNSSGQIGHVYASTNLVDWTPLGFPAENESGIFQFIDSDATNFAQRYYQLRSP
jgi:hypothetical protein